MGSTLTPVPSMPLQYGRAPEEGPAATPLVLDFSKAATFALDYSFNQNQGFLSLVQSVYVDNKSNTASVSIDVVGRSHQNITVPAGFQGFFTILVSGVIKINFASSGTVIVNIFLLNEPVMPAIWSANGTAGPSASVTIAGPNPLPISGTVAVSGTVPVTFTTPVNTFYGVNQTAMTGSAIQLSTILPASSPTSLRALNLQGDAANTGNITIGGSGVTAGVGLELAILGFKNYDYIDTTKIYVIGTSSQKLNIEAIN